MISDYFIGEEEIKADSRIDLQGHTIPVLGFYDKELTRVRLYPDHDVIGTGFDYEHPLVYCLKTYVGNNGKGRLRGKTIAEFDDEGLLDFRARTEGRLEFEKLRMVRDTAKTLTDLGIIKRGAFDCRQCKSLKLT